MNLAYILLGADSEELKSIAKMLWEESEINWNGDENIDGKTGVWTFDGDFREELQGMPKAFYQNGWELGRIIAHLDICELEKDPKLEAWAQMLAHFADVLLLKNAGKASQGFVRNWTKKFSDRPMLIKRWPEDAKQAADIIYPEARRLTQCFEEDCAQIEELKGLPIYIDEGDDDETDDKKFNSHQKPKHNVNEANLEDLDPIPEEKYFIHDAAKGWQIKVKAPTKTTNK